MTRSPRSRRERLEAARAAHARAAKTHWRAALVHDEAAAQAQLIGEAVREARERAMASSQRAAAKLEYGREERAAEALASFMAREVAPPSDSGA